MYIYHADIFDKYVTYYSDRVSNVSYLQLSLCGDHPENKKVDMLEKVNFISNYMLLNLIFGYNACTRKQDSLKAVIFASSRNQG